MDCFYAAVEMRDNPQWRDVPLAVGGSHRQRGVISTCNYQARKFGIHSAMPTAQAVKLCPQLVLVKGRMEVYQAISKQIRQIFRLFTPLIEPLSLDEAYLDVTDCSLLHGSATLIAEEIRRQIFAQTGLTASAGVAPIKFVAKIASDENKPDGICVVSPDELDTFVRRQPLKKIPGVGKVTAQKLAALGLQTCEDVRNSSLETLVSRFGKFGNSLWQRSHGIDPRPVVTSRQRKSVGVEKTVSQDMYTIEQCAALIDSLLPRLHQRMQAGGVTEKIASQGVKLKFSDFQQTTVEHRHGLYDEGYFNQLLEHAMTRAQGRGIRLVGLSVGVAEPVEQNQLPLPFSTEQQA